MEQNYHENHDKVLCAVKCKVTLPRENPKEAELFVTEEQMVIKMEEPLLIPLWRIRSLDVIPHLPHYGMMEPEPSEVIVEYYDALWQRQAMNIIMPPYDAGSLNYSLSQFLRNGKLIDLAARLKSIGVDVIFITLSGEQHQDTLKPSFLNWYRSEWVEHYDIRFLGSLQLAHTNIDKISVTEILEHYEDSVGKYYGAEFIVANDRVIDFSCFGQPKKRFRLFGKLVDYRWQGASLADWLAQDIELNELLRKTNAPKIVIVSNHICIRGKKLPSVQIFPCIDRIAQHVIRLF